MEDQIKTCERCGDIFQSAREDQCPICESQLDIDPPDEDSVCMASIYIELVRKGEDPFATGI